MSAFDSMLGPAMVGTDRQPVADPALAGELGAVAVEAIAGVDDAAERALRVIAVLAAAQQAAGRGRRATQVLPAAAAQDSAPELDDPAKRALLAWVFGEAMPRLQIRACRAVAQAGARLPAALLPVALDAAQRSRELRSALLPVLGARGRWLAQFSEAWKFAAGATDGEHAETRWTDGSLDERRLLLRAERAAMPQAARARLAAALPQLPARERAELLATLAIGLVPDDEALLAAQLSDRSKEVRQVAAALLAALPGSAFAQRAVARIETLMVRERKLLAQVWTIEPPTAFDPTWADDGIEAKRPAGESLGERAWWLMQLARAVPLGWWTERLGMTPTQLLHWARDTAWSHALMRGWRAALDLVRDPAWCDALLDNWPDLPALGDPSAVLALLPPARREKYWLRQLDGGWFGRRVAVGELVGSVLAATAPDEVLSPATSSALATAIVAALKGQGEFRDWTLRDQLPELCAALHDDSLVAVVSVVLPPTAPPAWTETLQRVCRVGELRTALRI